MAPPNRERLSPGIARASPARPRYRGRSSGVPSRSASWITSQPRPKTCIVMLTHATAKPTQKMRNSRTPNAASADDLT